MKKTSIFDRLGKKSNGSKENVGKGRRNNALNTVNDMRKKINSSNRTRPAAQSSPRPVHRAAILRRSPRRSSLSSPFSSLPPSPLEEINPVGEDPDLEKLPEPASVTVTIDNPRESAELASCTLTKLLRDRRRLINSNAPNSSVLISMKQYSQLKTPAFTVSNNAPLAVSYPTTLSNYTFTTGKISKRTAESGAPFTITVSGLRHETTLEQIMELFQNYGKILKIVMKLQPSPELQIPKFNGSALVVFETREMGLLAIGELDGVLADGNMIQVRDSITGVGRGGTLYSDK